MRTHRLRRFHRGVLLAVTAVLVAAPATVTSTGDKYVFTTVTAAMARAAGRHDVYLTFDGPLTLSSFKLSS
jgi:beta-glucosidase